MKLEHEEYVMKLYNYLKINPVKNVVFYNNTKITIYGNIINFLDSNANDQPRSDLKSFLIVPDQNYLKQESILTILDKYNDKKLEKENTKNILFQKQFVDTSNLGNSNLDYAYISNFISGFNTKITSNEEFLSFCLNLNRNTILNKNELYDYLLLFLDKNVDIINEKAELYYNSNIDKDSFLSKISSKIVTYLDRQDEIWNNIKEPLNNAIISTDEIKKYYLIDFDNINGCFFFKETFEVFKNEVESDDFDLYNIDNLKLFLFIKLIGGFFNEDINDKNYNNLINDINIFKNDLLAFYESENKKEETK